jgi:hypothetical protein
MHSLQPHKLWRYFDFFISEGVGGTKYVFTTRCLEEENQGWKERELARLKQQLVALNRKAAMKLLF